MTLRFENRSVVLVRAADAGPTYMSWTWMDTPDVPHAERLDSENLSAAMTMLDQALLSPLPLGRGEQSQVESKEDAASRALLQGAFASLDGERKLAALLTEAALPTTLRRQICERFESHGTVHVRITPSPRIARVPWELLFADADRRLLDIALVTFDPPATVHTRRSVLPPNWEDVRHLPPLHVLDPRLPPSALERGFRQTLSGLSKNALLDGISEELESVFGDQAVKMDVPRKFDRIALSDALKNGRSRLFYFGHVSSSPDEPGSASIHLFDTVGPRTSGRGQWGMAEPFRSATAPGHAASPSQDRHLPLCALDFLLGTQQCSDERVWSRYGSDRRNYGFEIWPIPCRVALIACEGGVDFRSAETFGLVIALVDSGASLVTTTRWTLPTDSAFHSIGKVRRSTLPTVELALVVDRAHGGPNAVEAVTHWQREQLRLWESNSGDLAYSPIVWASLTHTVAEARQVESTES
ncbi:hypothetical protein C7T36_13930 [Rhodococcus sp. AD45-ID]|uniref:hypothetical protein n=2 Tax=Rhodococcus TaxID=1827 RepID=UPI0005D2D9E1|nr:hypothetical protein [Rhodococcus globerulus]KJF24936.1 CHAT domain protein [Rhodococcus sp. AD45]PSR43163.1 hypothetical protein C7T36_13930 [Rhodococcus sp. AD45-ID]QXW00626.1 hypothetical protein KYT97_19760 [Rhodococcus globerulus]